MKVCGEESYAPIVKTKVLSKKRFIKQNFNSFQNVYNRYKDNPLWVQ